MGRLWTEQEIEFVKNNIGTMHQSEIGKYLNTSQGKISLLCKKYGIKKKIISFLEIKPELINEWDWEDNKHLDINKISYANQQKVSWVCSNGHKYKRVIADKVKHNHSCPDCLSLKEKFPELSLEWSDLNKVSPEDVSYGSKEKAFWVCPKCSSTYECRIQRRTSGINGCPYCDGKRINETNSLISLQPDLCEEWDYDKNEITPDSVPVGTLRKVWWKCKKCARSWETRINDRTKGSGCPTCNESKGEKLVEEVLTNLGLQFECQKVFEDCKDISYLKFDFFIHINDGMLIEFNGEGHYQAIAAWGGEEKLEKQRRRDAIKVEYCKMKSLPLLIIPYWEKENTKSLVMEFISEAEVK